eukprot:TRINITY_DN3754_c0_g5_i1.p1 TRINITY_DN3754_c0_g5~~TRINITY_DN3754_c0_g5_i1.p1  ORF type:complete len:327 (+),score=63.72 TRINITY_DN3754_c0_g5_i1:286-1266(+)
MYPLIASLVSLVLVLFNPSLSNPTHELTSFLTYSLNVTSFTHNTQDAHIFLPTLQTLYHSNQTITPDIVLGKFNLQQIEDKNVTKRVDMLCEFINSLRNNLLLKKSHHIKNNFPVLIVGSGPAGLISGIEVYLQGITNIQIFEKRNDYSRNIWFDVAGLPWSVALNNLKKWGWEHQEGIEQVSHQIGNNEVISMHAVTLEKFLSKVALILNITIHYNMEFLSLCNNTPQPYAIFKSRNDQHKNFNTEELCENKDLTFSRVGFQFIVGADGVNSKVRNSLHSLTTEPDTREDPFPVINTFTLAKSGGLQKKINDMRQTALIVNFKKK